MEFHELFSIQIIITFPYGFVKFLADFSVQMNDGHIKETQY